MQNSVLQCVAVCCSVLQCVAVRCIVLPSVLDDKTKHAKHSARYSELNILQRAEQKIFDIFRNKIQLAAQVHCTNGVMES